MACSFEQSKDSSGSWTITGAACSGDLEYDGDSVIAAYLWSGDDGAPPLATIPSGQVSWTPPPNVITVVIHPADLADIEPGYVYLIVDVDGDRFAASLMHVQPGIGS